MNAKIFLTALALTVPFAFAAPAGAADLINWNEMPWDAIHCSDNPEEVKDMFHVFVEPTNPELSVAVHTYCLGGVLDSDRGTGCTSHAYALTGFKWGQQFPGFKVDVTNSGLTGSAVLNGIDAAGNAWDVETAFDVYGASSLGGSGSAAGRSDGVHQLGWKRLSGTTIAQTTTWYYTSTKLAVESDAAYNTGFTWGVNGESNKMDFQGIATHEIGHTFGLNHPQSTTANQCLTMYAYGANGQTHQRTLGDGDIYGIEAIYGA